MDDFSRVASQPASPGCVGDADKSAIQKSQHGGLQRCSWKQPCASARSTSICNARFPSSKSVCRHWALSSFAHALLPSYEL